VYSQATVVLIMGSGAPQEEQIRVMDAVAHIVRIEHAGMCICIILIMIHDLFSIGAIPTAETVVIVYVFMMLCCVFDVISFSCSMI